MSITTGGAIWVVELFWGLYVPPDIVYSRLRSASAYAKEVEAKIFIYDNHVSYNYICGFGFALYCKIPAIDSDGTLKSMSTVFCIWTHDCHI